MLGNILNMGVRPETQSASAKRRQQFSNAIGLLFVLLFLFAGTVTVTALGNLWLLVGQSSLLLIGLATLWLNYSGRARLTPGLLAYAAPFVFLALAALLQGTGVAETRLIAHLMPKVVLGIFLLLPALLLPYRNDWNWRLNFAPGLAAFLLMDVVVLLAGDAHMRDLYWGEKLFVLNAGILAPSFVMVAGVSYFLNLNEMNETRVTELLHSEEQKNRELDEAHTEILDSIRYAKRIQTSILPERSYIERYLPELTVFYLPKDVVSGDFYWFAHLEQQNISILAAVDCTGHGVPGAFMSVIGYNLLNRIVLELEITEPEAVLTELDRQVRAALKQDEEGASSRDGMDLALCVYRHDERRLEFAGAQRPLAIMRNGDLTEYKGDKFPVGGALEGDKLFTRQTFELEPGDRAYVYSDGFVDQFGGPAGRKFTPKRLRNLITDVQRLPMKAQEDRFASAFREWQGELDQLDDVTLLAFEAR